VEQKVTAPVALVRKRGAPKKGTQGWMHILVCAAVELMVKV
jgi:hypothetical protein